MAKRKVTQEDLRKMMAQVKTSKGVPATSAASKRYKLSSRELALLEEQKKEDERKRAKEKEKKAAALSSLPALPAPDAAPKKSILKNKPAVQFQFVRPVVPVSSTSTSSNSEKIPADIRSSDEAQEKDPDTLVKQTNDSEEQIEESSSTLPQGFFDDPVLDAKARNVQYVDTAEEQWERFQKEIGDELTVAQDILVEDRNEATIDRQIEEIDEQMRAWNRVAEMEKKKDFSAKVKQESGGKLIKKEESDDEEDFEEFLDWRTKK